MMKTDGIRTYSKDGELVKQRRMEIQAKALKLFMRKGYTHSSTRMIAEECGMSVGTLYYYVGSKEDILNLISEENSKFQKSIMDDVFSRKKSFASITEKIEFFIDHYIRLVDQVQDAIVFWHQEVKYLNEKTRKKIFEIDQDSRSFAEQILVEGNHSGEFQVIDTEFVANTIIVLCDMWAFKRWMLRNKYSREEFTKKVSKFVVGSITGLNMK